MADEEVATRPVPVRVFVRNGMVIDGFAHVHATAYERRVSDVLNVSPPNFLPITDATCERDGESFQAETVLVNAGDIVLLVTEAAEARPIGDDSDLPGSPL